MSEMVLCEYCEELTLTSPCRECRWDAHNPIAYALTERIRVLEELVRDMASELQNRIWADYGGDPDLMDPDPLRPDQRRRYNEEMELVRAGFRALKGDQP